MTRNPNDEFNSRPLFAVPIILMAILVVVSIGMMFNGGGSAAIMFLLGLTIVASAGATLVLGVRKHGVPALLCLMVLVLALVTFVAMAPTPPGG